MRCDFEEHLTYAQNFLVIKLLSSDAVRLSLIFPETSFLKFFLASLLVSEILVGDYQIENYNKPIITNKISNSKLEEVD